MSDEEPTSADSIRLVVPKRKSPESIRNIAALADDETRVEALLARLEQTPDPSARSRILVEIAITMRDGLDDAEQALEALLEAWRSDPRNDDILDNLEPLVRAQDKWTELMELTRALAGAERVPDRSLAYHEAMVRWLTRDRPDPSLARQWVERVRVIDSTHALVHFMQAALSREHGDLKREIDELDLAVLSTRRKDERLPIHLLLASRYMDERTYNRVEAKKQYEQAHKLFPQMMDPLRGLEQIAVAEKDNHALADVLRRQADAEVEEPERVQILMRLAKLQELEFRRPELAAKTLERIASRSAKLDFLFDDLERCYRAARMWPELLAVLERAAISDDEPEKRAARLKRLGEVLEAKMGDIRAALDTYKRLAGLMPEDETVVTELARLAEKVSDVELAVNCRERLAELTTDPIARARHNLVAGQLLTPIDGKRARRFFEQAVASDPTNAPAWNALLWDARAENDLPRAAHYLEQRANATETPRARATCFVELAEIQQKMGNRPGMLSAYESAFLSDPSNEAAASALLEPWMAIERYEDVEKIIHVIIAAAERDRDGYRAYTARRALTKIGFELHKPDVALEAAFAAFNSRREEDEARRDLVLAASAMRADPAVLKVRDALLVIAERPDGLAPDVRVALGETLASMGESDRAASLYDEVLTESPDNERALAGLSQHHAASGNKVASLALKRQRAMAMADPKERLATLLETAEAFAKIDQEALAAEVYEAARVLAPNDLPILHKLLALYQKASKWVSLFDVLRSIAEVDADPLRRAKTYFTMGQIASVELLDRGTALEMFDRALDVDATQLEAFENIVKILTRTKDWAGLEQMYRRMLARAEARRDQRLSFVLNKQLAIILRDRVGDAQGAIEAIRAATKLVPEDDESQAILRELLSHTGQAQGAVAITLERVLKEPLDPRPYPALFDLLLTQGQRDRALCVASAMTFLDVNHPSATAWRQTYAPPPIEAIVRELGPEGYRYLLHPELDPTLTEILQICAPAVIDIALSRLSLRERMSHPGSALKGQDWLGKVVARAAQILGVPAPPKLFARKTPGPAIAAAPTKPPSLLVYTQSLAGVSREALAFMIGKRVMELTPPLLARALCPSITELKALASSAARIATEQIEPGDQPLRERLKRDDVARIGAAVRRSMMGGGRIDVVRWSQLADVSVSCAGLLLAGDLEAARAAIAIEPQAPGDLSPRDKMRELVAWYLGDACARLRQGLGLAIL
ncbi:MAG: tetratricopeptide repeat protein [Labilithrix sp.]|nr:tetratricopeptide repeat protein [Labilithrix sp.]MCW5813472.1 tetratricopeptide repeat protein [Labilithrix sp.]